MTIPLLTSIERLSETKLNPLLAPGYDGYNRKTYPSGVVPTLYSFMCWINTTVFRNYVGQTFSMGSYTNCVNAFSGFLFIPHGLMVAAYLVMQLLPSKRDKDRKQL